MMVFGLDVLAEQVIHVRIVVARMYQCVTVKFHVIAF